MKLMECEIEPSYSTEAKHNEHKEFISLISSHFIYFFKFIILKSAQTFVIIRRTFILSCFQAFVLYLVFQMTVAGSFGGLLPHSNCILFLIDVTPAVSLSTKIKSISIFLGVF